MVLMGSGLGDPFDDSFLILPLVYLDPEVALSRLFCFLDALVPSVSAHRLVLAAVQEQNISTPVIPNLECHLHFPHRCRQRSSKAFRQPPGMLFPANLYPPRGYLAENAHFKPNDEAEPWRAGRR